MPVPHDREPRRDGPGHEAHVPLVSVVVPCRNAEVWLEETLSSVRDQNGPSIELIVVDDGSTDGSADIAERMGAQVRRCPPQGVSRARDIGTALARGTYLQYLDADDVLTPGTLAERVEVLERTGADVALVTWTKWVRERDGEFVAGETLRRQLGERPDVDLLTDAWWPPGAILYRRTIVERIGGWRADLPIIQDARFLLDAALCGASFEYVDHVGLKYRVHGNASLSRRDPRAFVEDCYRSAADLHDRWLSEGTLDDARRRGLVRVMGYVARSLFPLDRARFEMVLERIRTLDANYLPEGPRSLRMLSSLVGYRSAEHVAVWWRQMKAFANRP